jgi:drug/metabolite transporter (DMT)-like permease
MRDMILSDRIAGNAVGVLSMVVWATHFPVAVLILATWDPLLFTPVRVLLAGLIVSAAGLALSQGRAMGLLLFDRRVLISGVAFGLSSLCFVWAQKHTSPVTAAVIISATPLLSALMGWLAGRERITGVLIAGLLLALAGGVMTSAASAEGSVKSSFAGAASMLAAVILYVWYARLLVYDFAAAPVVAKTAASTLAAGALTAMVVAAATALGLIEPSYDFSPRTLALIAWLGLAVGVSAVLWFWVGGKIGVTVAALHNNLVPFYVILIAALMGGAVNGHEVLGATLVVAGAVLAQWPAPAGASRRQDA